MLKAGPHVSVWRGNELDLFHTQVSHRASAVSFRSVNNKDHLRETLLREKQIPTALSHFRTQLWWWALRYRSPLSVNSYLGFSSFVYSSSSRQEVRARPRRRVSVCFMHDGRDGTLDATVNISHPESNYMQRKKNRPERRFNKVPDDRFGSLLIVSVGGKNPVAVRHFSLRKRQCQNK